MTNCVKLARVKKLIDLGAYDAAWNIIVAEITKNKKFLGNLIDVMKEKADDPS